MKTALVLFEGSYSGVIVPEKHYIPLKKDYSNVSAVFEALRDVDRLTALTERAYRDIIEGQQHSYGTFVQRCDRYLEGRAGRARRATIVSVPVVAFSQNGESAWPVSARGPALVSQFIADGLYDFERASTAVMAAVRTPPRRPRRRKRQLLLLAAWRLLPARFRAWLRVRIAPAPQAGHLAARSIKRGRLTGWAAHVLPPSVRDLLESRR